MYLKQATNNKRRIKMRSYFIKNKTLILLKICGI